MKTGILAGLASVLLFMAVGCVQSPPPPVYDDCTSSVWLAGDSLAWPTADRIGGVYSLGVGGAGYVAANNIGDHVSNALAACEVQPDHLLLIGGVNDFSIGATVAEVSAARAQLVADVEALGIEVSIVTEPYWSVSQVAELNLAADILVPEAYWGQSVDGLHPLDFTQFAAYLQAELVGLGIL